MSTAQAVDVMYPRIVGDLRGRLFSAAELAGVTGVSERQVQRWASGASRPEGRSRTKLLEMHYIIEQLREVYTDEGAEIWLHGRNHALGGRRPIDFLEEGQIDVVLEIIEQLRVGTM